MRGVVIIVVVVVVVAVVCLCPFAVAPTTDLADRKMDILSQINPFGVCVRMSASDLMCARMYLCAHVASCQRGISL